MRPAAELATRIGRALISASNKAVPAHSWNPSLEQLLHKLASRDSLSPSLVAGVIDPHLLTHHSLALGFFNWASQQPGFTHTSLTYQSILKSLSLSRQFNSIGSLLKQARVHRLTLDSSTHRFVIHSLIQGKRTQSAFLFFNEVKSQILYLGPEICNSLLAVLSSDGYIDNAMKVFDEMSKRGVAFNTIGFGVFIWKLCRNADLGKVLSLLDEVKAGNSMINGSIMAVLIVHGLCQASRVSEASWVLNELRIRDCKPDFMAYRIVAEAFRLTGSVVDVNKVLKMKRKLGVSPRSDEYGDFILGLILERRISEAKELGEVIVHGNFPIRDDVLNTLIGSVSSIDPSSAMMFFNFMVGEKRLPTLLTLRNLSENLYKHGKNNELLELYHVLSSNNYFSDMESYIVMFTFLCKAGNVREAYEVLQETKKKGLGPDVEMYNSLMESCCRGDLLRPAKRLWDEMFATGCGVNLKTYNILIGKLSKISEVEEALMLFNQMWEKGLAPDAMTYTSLLEGLCEEAKFEEAVEVFNKSVGQDVRLSETILSTFILLLCRKGQFVGASKLLRSLSCDTRLLDSQVVLLKCLADAKQVLVAIDHVKWIRDTSPSMVQVIFSQLEALLSSSLELDPILHLLQEMAKQCTDSSANTWKPLYSNSYN